MRPRPQRQCVYRNRGRIPFHAPSCTSLVVGTPHSYDRRIDEWQNLLGKLDSSFENADWNHATHRETGVVYDMRVIKRKIAEIEEELKDVEDYLDG